MSIRISICILKVRVEVHFLQYIIRIWDLVLICLWEVNYIVEKLFFLFLKKNAFILSVRMF